MKPALKSIIAIVVRQGFISRINFVSLLVAINIMPIVENVLHVIVPAQSVTSYSAKNVQMVNTSPANNV